MISSIVSRLVILVFGTLYPAYASYKAVRSRDVREYVKWMMYWIVFALFTCGETITDVFLSFWFPFYYEIKIGFVLWLLSPATKGSSILYRKFVHPMLTNREQEIDEYIARAKEQGYHTVLHLGSKGVNYATNVIMQTAIKGGGGLVNQLRKSYSLSDLTDGEGEPVRDVNRNGKDVDGLEYRGNRRTDRVDGSRSSNRARGYSPRRSASGSARMEMYFPEVDLDVRQRRGSSRSREASVPLSHIRSSEDVSSSYTSGDHFYEDAVDMDQASEESSTLVSAEGPLVRTASVGSTRSTRAKGSTSTRGGASSTASTAAKKATQGEKHMDGSSSEEEDFWSDPLDHITPPPDRTLFVNDLNTFPVHQPKLAVEFISSSAEVSQTTITGVDVINANVNYNPIDKQLNVKEDEEAKCSPVETLAQPNEILIAEISIKSNGSNPDPESMNVIACEISSLVACKDSKSDQSSPSASIINSDINSEPKNDSSVQLESEKKNGEMKTVESPRDHAKEPPGPEIPTISPSPALESTVPARSDTVVDIKEASHATASSVNAAEFDSKLTSEETKILPTSCHESSVSMKPIFASASATPVIKQTEHCVLEDASKILSSEPKEGHAITSRGGKYNKRPAPEPPRNEEGSRGPSAELANIGGDTVHARLILKRGIVRSLPDVGLASSGDPLVRPEVFMPVNASQRCPPSPSPSTRSELPTKHNDVDSFLAGNRSKNQSGKESVGFPRFLNLSGRPHFGSLTSLFPFWHGGTLSETPFVVSPRKLDESIIKSKKISAGSIGCTEATSGFDSHITSMDEQKDQLKVDDAGKNNVSERGRVQPKINFPVRQLSHSPSRSRMNRRF